MTRSWRFPLLILSVLVAGGCLGDPTDPPDGDQPGEQRFTLVHVLGNESYEPPPQQECDYPFDHRLDLDVPTLVYNSDRYEPDRPTLVVAFDHFVETSDCPLVYRLHMDESAVTVEMGEYGNLTIDPGEDGKIAVVGEEGTETLPEEGSITYPYERQSVDHEGRERSLEGRFVVKHLGSRPLSMLEPR